VAYPRAMAPVPPMGRDRAIELVLAGRLPLRFGSPHPSVIVLHQDGVYRIRGLEVDQADARASHDAALARGESWMAEHYHALGRPTGPVHAEAASIEELVDTMRTMPWPASW
jgi:hypothetical protein